MVNFTILAGGFTSFIATYVLDTDTGSLTLTKQNPSGASASWIARHPTDPTTLYSVNEIGPVGSVQSFLVDEEGGLTVVDTAPTGGNGPTYTEFLSTGEVTGLNVSFQFAFPIVPGMLICMAVRFSQRFICSNGPQ
jgi:6-phosphogluconolactonase (cycloisomerase 2 family)